MFASSEVKREITGVDIELRGLVGWISGERHFLQNSVDQVQYVMDGETCLS